MSEDISEALEKVMERIQSSTAKLSTQEIASRREHADRLARGQVIAELRSNWNAPKRHVAHSQIDLGGEWGKKLAALKALLGSGFLTALVGGRGPGKTQMAVELMRHTTSQLRPAYYLTATEFFIRVKTTYRDDGRKSESDVLKELRRPKLLIVDEVGKRAETPWENNLLFELINKRYDDLSDTVLIDNNEPAEFCKAIGPSLSSRINETGGVIHFNWQSFRERNQ
jgi:hypothetical protein